MRFRLLFLAFFFAIFSVLTLSTPVFAGPNGWCWCTGPDADGNVCARTNPPPGASCAAPGPVNSDDTGGFDVCCSNPLYYGSAFALKSPVCGSSSEVLPECSYDSGQLLFCWGNDFVTEGGQFPVGTGYNDIIEISGPVTYAGLTYPNVKDEIWVCSAGNTGCGTPVDHSNSPDPANTPPRKDFPEPGAPGGSPAVVPLCSDQFPGGLPDPNTCYYEGALSRPGGSCKERVPYVHDNLDQYTLSCVTPPEVNLNFQTCNQDEFNDVVVDYDTGGRFKTGCGDASCYIDMRLLVNFSSLQLGSLGPTTYTPSSPDSLARVYPYSGLADKPLFIDSSTQKEAFRTWWRLQPLVNQLNAKAAFLTRADQRANSLPAKFKRWLGDLTNIPIFKESVFPYNPRLSAENSDPSYHKALADYMNDIIDGTSGTAFLRLLSPVFNLTNPETKAIIDGMADNEANFAGLYGFAGNTYTISGRSAMDYFNDFIAGYLDQYSKQIILTEYGDFATFGVPKEDRGPSHPIIQTMIGEFSRAAADGRVLAALYFNAMNNNPGFKGHELRGDEYQTIIASAPTKAGINSAANINGSPGGFPDQICRYYPGGCPPAGGYTLEIAFSGGDVPSTIQAIKNAHERGMIPVVRICAGDTCDFADSQSYVDFLNAVDAGVSNTWYAIAGPNEPDNEHWVTGKDEDVTTYETDQFRLEDLLFQLPGCLKNYPVCDQAVNLYTNLPKDVKGKYDALQPFNFDNVRGYLGLSYVDPTTGNKTAGVLAENLPYVQALRDILADPAGGILTNLSPDWLNELRYPSTFTNNNYTTTYPAEGPLPFPDAASGEKNNAQAVIGYAEAAWGQDSQCRVVDQKKTKLSLSSPLTYAKKIPIQGPYDQLPGSEYRDVLDQAVLTPVTVQVLEPNDVNNDCVPESSQAAKPRKYIAALRGEDARDANLPVRSTYGRTITVLTNPKFTDVSRLIAGPLENSSSPLYGPNPESPSTTSNNALVPLLLPKAIAEDQKFLDPDDQDKPTYGQSAGYNSQHEPNFSSHRATAGDSGTGSSAVPRKAGLAQILLCQLRNYWLRPLGLQLGTAQSCEDPATPVAATPSPAACGEVKQHLFEPTCSGTACYQTVISQSLATSCNGNLFNPYVAIAIALNEDGGLVSGKPDGSNVKHFGCDPFGTAGVGETIPAKLSCMLNTFANDCKAGKTESQALAEYGYLPGNNLNALIGLLGGSGLNLWLSSSAAGANGNSLSANLPGQRQLWADYYRGYLDDYQETCTTSSATAPGSVSCDGLKIQLVGDSITAGYSSYLPAALEAKGITGYTIVGTQGYPAQKPSSILSRIQSELPSTQPDIALVHVGTNGFGGSTDASGNCVADYNTAEATAVENIISTLKNSPSTPIVLHSTMIPRRAYRCDPVQQPLFNDRIRQITRTQGVTLIEMASLLQPTTADYTAEDYSGSGGLNPAYIHPNASGYQRLADTWATAVASACR